MRLRFAPLALLSLSVLTVASQAPAADGSKPTVVLRVAAVKTLIEDTRYLMQAIGKAEDTKEVEEFLKKLSGPDGLKGVDPTKPIGAYAVLNAELEKSDAVILLPVSKPKDLLDFLAMQGIKLEDPKDGLYTVNANGVLPEPIYFRFANGYAYITYKNDKTIAKEKLLKPETVFAATPNGTMSVTVHLDQVPDELKKIFLEQAERSFAEQKDMKMPGEGALQKALRLAAFDETFDLLKAVTNEGGPVSLVFDIDRTTDQVSISARFAAVPSSPLAGRIARLAQNKTLSSALLAPNSASYVGISVSLPNKLRTTLNPFMDEQFKKLLEDEKDKDKRELMSQVLKAITPTLQAGELDAAFDMRGPSPQGTYTLVSAVKVRNGLNMEKAFAQVLDKAPPAVAAMFKLNTEKVGSVNIHRFDLGDNVPDEDFKKLFGSGPLYFAFRDDAIFVVLGDNALPEMSKAVTVLPKPGPIFRSETSLSRSVPLLQKEYKDVAEIARSAFKVKGSDRISITLEGGKEINLKMSMKVQVIGFIFKLAESKNKAL